MIFRSDLAFTRRKQRNRSGKQTAISKEAGFLWSTLPDDVRSTYGGHAAQEKQDHKAAYPNYVYKPARKSRSKKIEVKRLSRGSQ